MANYKRNTVIAAKIENILSGVTTAATFTATVAAGVITNLVIVSGGTGYPASKTIDVFFLQTGASGAAGQITTSAGGIVTSVVVMDGGNSGYTATAGGVTCVAMAQASYGVFSAPVPGTDAMLVGTDLKIKPNVIMVERDVHTGSMGGKQMLPGEASVEISFTIELAGSGNAVSEVAWALLIKCAGASGALTAGTKWDYTPITDNFPSMSMRIWRAGWFHNIKGAQVSKIEFDFTVSTCPTAAITIIGIDMARIATVSMPTPNLTAWKTPIVITDANTGDIRFGSAYNSSTGAFTGGTAYGSKGLKLTWDNSAKFRPFLGGSGVRITNREITGSMSLDLSGTDAVTFYNAFKANTLSSLSFSIGSTPGSIFKIFMQGVERSDPTDEDDDDLLLAGWNFRARSSGYGMNDEIRLITM